MRKEGTERRNCGDGISRNSRVGSKHGILLNPVTSQVSVLLLFVPPGFKRE
jgi:hypothetical protein